MDLKSQTHQDISDKFSIVYLSFSVTQKVGKSGIFGQRQMRMH